MNEKLKLGGQDEAEDEGEQGEGDEQVGAGEGVGVIWAGVAMIAFDL